MIRCKDIPVSFAFLCLVASCVYLDDIEVRAEEGKLVKTTEVEGLEYARDVWESEVRDDVWASSAERTVRNHLEHLNLQSFFLDCRTTTCRFEIPVSMEMDRALEPDLHQGLLLLATEEPFKGSVSGGSVRKEDMRVHVIYMTREGFTFPDPTPEEK